MFTKEQYFYNNNKTILFVDNDESSYVLVSELLADYNFKVLHAKCGKSAIKYFKENPYIVMVLTEIRLFHLNGFEVLEKIRAINPDIPVIAQTTDVQCQVKARCIHAGFNDYILKPIDFDFFIQVIKKHLILSFNKN